MYAAEIVEMSSAQDLFQRPKHPYTEGLMKSFPALSGPKVRITGIPGAPPDLLKPPVGCRFSPRCPHCTHYRATVRPVLQEVEPNHFVACHLYAENPSKETVDERTSVAD
jgi:peptide/nickel transport system ATP-binding protein